MNQDERTGIDPLDLWRIFVRRLPIMILAACIVGGIYWGYTEWVVPPSYTSVSTLYILKQQNEEETVSDNSTASDFSLALNVVNDCTYLLKSHSVLDAVIANENLNYSYNALYRSISTANPRDTRVLQVSVTAESPELAKQIVDAVCEIGVDKIEEAMGFQQVNVYEQGTFDEERSNGATTRTIVTVGAGAALLIYILFVVLFLLDDRIRSDEELEKKLGLTILGRIPVAHAKGRK